MPVYVPPFAVKDKFVDYEREMLNCMRVPRSFRGRFFSELKLYPVTLGAMGILEALDCVFVRSPHSAKAKDLFTAAAVLDAGRNAPRLLEERYREKYCAYIEFFFAEALIGRIDELISHFTEEPFTGYEKITGVSGGAPEAWLFGASTIGNMISCVSKICAVPPDAVLWEMPLTLCGHLTAAQCENTSRPKDPEDIKLQLKLAREREERGEPHPWQIKYPDDYPPTLTQLKNNPGIFEEIRKADNERS